MTKKDYIEIARVLKSEKDLIATLGKLDGFDAGKRAIATDVVDSVAMKLCTVFKNDNPRFDQERFLAAVDAK